MMKLKVFGSSSKGNAYLLDNGKDALLLEAGINPRIIKQQIGEAVGRIAACLISHEHGDHAAYAAEVADMMIPIYATEGTLEAIEQRKPIRGKTVALGELTKPVDAGAFKVRAFHTRHDAAEPSGFIVWHRDTGNILFATDTYYIPYRFNGISHMMIECNYDTEILDRNTENGSITYAMKSRTVKSHMSLDTCRAAVLAYKGQGHILRNVILIHLSDRNANKERFQAEIEKVTRSKVIVAEPGMEIEMNDKPF